MAYDERLAERMRGILAGAPGVDEKKMFGGVAFLKEGKMFCGIVKDELMVRAGPKRYEAALAEAHVRPMDFTGRPMNGYVFVGPGGTRTEKAIKRWVDQGAAFVATLDDGATKSVGSLVRWMGDFSRHRASSRRGDLPEKARRSVQDAAAQAS